MSDSSSSEVATDRRSAILVAAARICARDGFGGASLREIADEAGIKKGLLTYYFPTKDDLVFEVITRLHRRFDDAAESWIADGAMSPVDRLVRSLEGHVTVVLEHPDEVLVESECSRQLSPDRQRSLAEGRRRYEGRLVELVEECRASTPLDDLPTPVLVSTALCVMNSTHQWLDPSMSRSALADLASIGADRALAAILSTSRAT